jgi:RHS repeat-associated protein
LPQASAWRGKYADITGFIFLGARYYDPCIGRFLSCDPVWSNRDPNYHTFAGGDPINYFDPDGRWGKQQVDYSHQLADTGNVGKQFLGMAYGLVGAVSQIPYGIQQTFEGANQGMAEAREEISTYEGGKAFLARTAMLPADFAFGTTRLVNQPVSTIAGMPQGFVNFGGKIGNDIYNIGSNPSVNTAFNIAEDALGVWGMTQGAVGITRGAANLVVDNSTPKVFWSGGSPARQAAETFASANGGQTLEMTFMGSILDAITTKGTYPFLKPLWDKASFDFASSAEGAVDVFQSGSRGVRVNSVWSTVEYPQLQLQGNQINYHIAP